MMSFLRGPHGEPHNTSIPPSRATARVVLPSPHGPGGDAARGVQRGSPAVAHQFSPVIMRNSVSMAVGKATKLACRVMPLSVRLTLPHMFMPNTA